MRSDFRRSPRHRRCGVPTRLGARLGIAAAIALTACAADRSLEAADPARRLGGDGGHVKSGTVSKRVLAAQPGQSITLPVASLPASRISLAVALRDPSTGTGGPVRCSARLTDAGGKAAVIATLDPVLAAPGWAEATASVPATKRADLTLDCKATDGSLPAVVWAQPLAVPRDTGQSAPLVVLVSLDTLRADRVSGFGGPHDLTPNLGRLGDEGLRLLATTSEGTWTPASHYALLFSRLYGVPLAEKPLTSLARALGDAGWITLAATGGGFMSAAFNTHLGFDHFEEFGAGRDALRDVADAVLGWIQHHADAPTFVFLHTFAPHEYPPEEVAWRKVHGEFSIFRPDARQVKSARAFYTDVVRRTDASLAPFLDALGEIAEDRPVAVVIVSDHGEAFGEHANFRHGFGDRLVTLHDEVIRVPGIVWAPGIVPAGTTSRRPTMLADVAPSLLSGAGVAVPRSMRGDNLWPQWIGGGDASVPATAGSVSHTDGAWALRGSSYKLIVAMSPKRNRVELYDLDADPGEGRNLAGSDRPSVARLTRALRDRLAHFDVQGREGSRLPRCSNCGWKGRKAFWATVLGDAPDKVPGPIDAETLQRLRDLGYGEDAR